MMHAGVNWLYSTGDEESACNSMWSHVLRSYLASLASLILFVAAQCTCLAEDAIVAYKQARDSFLAIEIEFTWGTRPTSEFSDSLQREIDSITKAQSGPLPDAVVDEIKRGSGEDVPFEEAKKLYFGKLLQQKQALRDGRPIPDRFTIQVTPEITDVRVFLNAADENPRRKHAAVNGLPSFTGGDYKRVQRKNEGKWLGVEPYPRINRRTPVAWAESTLLLQTMLPPFVDPASHFFKTFVSGSADDFWKDSEQITTVGTITSLTGDELHLLLKPLSDLRFGLAAVSERNQFMPEWVSEWQCIDENSVNDVTQEVASKLAGQVEYFRANSATNTRLEAVPETLVFFESYKQVEGGGLYPFSVIHKPIVLLSTEESVQQKMDWHELPFGVKEIGLLQVQSITANAFVVEREPLKLSDGTVFLDLDSNLCSVIGETPDQAIRRLLANREKPSTLRTTMIVANVIAVSLLLGYYLFRKRWAR